MGADSNDLCRSCSSFWGSAFDFVVCLGLVGAVIAVGITVSLQDGALSSQTIVLTGVRTRDWNAPNAYSMHGRLEDEHTRLYACMKQSKFVGGSSASLSSSLEDYRIQMIKFFGARNCDSESDNSYPRDYGFLECITAKLALTVNDRHLFLACLDTTEGVMVESIQTPASRAFLGSYNQVAMLLVSAASLVTFVVFMSGGFLMNEAVYMKGLSIQGYSPLSIWSNLFALIVAVVWMGLAFFYAFPPVNVWSDVKAQAGYKSFPNTPWTGYLASFWFFSLVLYFTYFLAQDWFRSKDGEVDAASGATAETGLVTVPTDATSSGSSPPFYDFSLPPARALPMPPARATAGRGPASTMIPGLVPTFSRVPSAFSNDGSMFSSRGSSGITEPPSRSGTPNGEFYGAQTYSGPYDPYTPPALQRTVSMLLPSYLVKGPFYKLNDGSDGVYYSRIITRVFPEVISWALISSDGPLLLGMLNSQNSPLNETVIDIFFYITLCRLFQLAAVSFLDDFLAGKYFERLNSDHEFYGNFLACHLASVCCFIVAGYHFLLAADYTGNIAKLSIGMQSNGLQISLLVVLAVFEALKVISVLLTIFNVLQGQGYLNFVRFQFTAEWMARLLFIIIAIFVYAPHLRDQNDVLVSYLSP